MRSTHLLLASLLLLLPSCQETPSTLGEDGKPVPSAPASWEEWAQWVDQNYSVGDGQGHGPDVGSQEWAFALDQQLGISGASGHGPDIRSQEWRRAVERKMNNTSPNEN